MFLVLFGFCHNCSDNILLYITSTLLLIYWYFLFRQCSDFFLWFSLLVLKNFRYVLDKQVMLCHFIFRNILIHKKNIRGLEFPILNWRAMQSLVGGSRHITLASRPCPVLTKQHAYIRAYTLHVLCKWYILSISFRHVMKQTKS